MNRTTWCPEHEVLEEVETVRRIDKAGESQARLVYGTTTEGCIVSFMSSLPWKKDK